MIESSCEFLSKSGWGPVRDGVSAVVKSKNNRLCIEWEKLQVDEFSGLFTEVISRFIGFCVSSDMMIPAINYGSNIHGGDSGQRIPPAYAGNGQWVAVSNFMTQRNNAKNPCIPYLNSYTKITDTPPSLGTKIDSTWHLDDTAQFRLIPDLVKYNRFADIAKWHGRSKISGLNGDEMHGVVEFANYPAETIDQIELSALGDNRRIERLSPKLLRVFPDRYRTRIPLSTEFRSTGYRVSGNYSFLLVRYKGKIAII